MIVAHLLDEYLDENNNEWPRDWAELSLTYEENFRKPSDWHENLRFTFAELQERVTIDFNVDGSELLEICATPERAAKFRPISSRLGNQKYGNYDPNERLRQQIFFTNF